MSIVSSLFRPQVARNNLVNLDNPLAGFASSSASGVSVTVDKALSVSTVFDCLRVIGEDVAQVPLKIYTKAENGGQDEAKDHPLYDLLYAKPNDWQTSFEFRENLVFQAGLLGNFYAYKNRVRGKIVSLIPFEPNTVTPKIDDLRRIIYEVTLEDGSQKTYSADEIWHIRGPSWKTHIGMEALKYAREAIGLSLNIEKSQNQLHANGVQTSGVFSVEGTLSETQYNNLHDWIMKKIGGSNKLSPLILDRNGKFQPTSHTGVDAQVIENRRFQIEEMCRHFRMMPIMIGQADKAATYASSSEMFLAHIKYTLMPWYGRIESSINGNLLTREERAAGYYSKFNAKALMRGAAKDRAEFYWKMYQMKALNPNEIRSYEDENPYDGGEEYFVAPGSQPMDNTNDPKVP